MQINSINKQANNNPNFLAVNQKYLNRAKKEFCRKHGMVGDILECMSADVYFKQMHVDDAIDTIEAIKKMAGKTNDFMEHVLGDFKNYKKMFNQ